MKPERKLVTTGRSTAPAPSADPTSPVLVLVKQVGGVAGSNLTPCTFTYDAWPVGSDTANSSHRIVVAGTPKRKRTSVGTYTAGGDYSLGLAWRNPLNAYAWELLDVYEEVRNCRP